MNVIYYQNLLNGEFDQEQKINQWFDNFLDSFKEHEYFTLDLINMPAWQYKNMVNTAKENNVKMLTSKQWEIFRKYIKFENGAYEKFSNFIHKGRKFRITISDKTGFCVIKID